MVAARPKSRRFCRNGPNKQKRPKKRQKSGLPSRHCGGALRQHLICKYAPDYYKEHWEVGEIGGSFSKTVKPIVSLPLVICCGRLVVVSSIPPGDFLNVFFGKSSVFCGRRACGSGFWSTQKSDRGAYSHRFVKHAQTPKIALLALKTTRFESAPRALRGAFLGVRADSSRRT